MRVINSLEWFRSSLNPIVLNCFSATRGFSLIYRFLLYFSDSFATDINSALSASKYFL